MRSTPRLSIGLPVYNGEDYLAESLDALLGQTFTDFELIISDNASTDGTEQIGRQYAARDERVRYVRQPRNLGAIPNHNLLVDLARGELFKWASHDDLYARTLLERCIAELDAHPDAVLCHAWQGIIDEHGRVVQEFDYPLATDAVRPSDRFASVLFTVGGDDFYAVMRTDDLRRTPLNGSYHHSDRTIIAELALLGRFLQVPEILFFRRDHPGRAERARPTKRARAANMDPRRADRLRNPTVRLLGEYVWGFVSAIQRAPLSSAERRACYAHLSRWLGSRIVSGGSTERIEDRPRLDAGSPPSIDLDEIVAGRAWRTA
ncbi:glycosyltransferase family 2 protein [Pseudonocardia benzenivorans]|uniref:Glycosyltransferase family 2 protein n=1 Tax=Pseudonocardia benzenivorans TaxID=228005 RepID=A0ABW3VGK8_9PSEU|nr:glycosyltransferase family 2 protein [Pseudonocardia dioxanivorans]